jgi:hypothetical protein
MKTTALSSSARIYDPIRKKRVAKTPEEQVRQCLLRQMLGPLAFPKGLVAVEAPLQSGRRADLIAFRVEGDALIPLLVIECKAAPLKEADYFQGSGYQWILEAPFLCLAHGGGICTFWKEGEELRSVPFLPPYEQLVRRVLR